MARVTVEDCIDKVENRFELVMVAAQRARKIGSGAALTVERNNDKNPVIALREIAGGTIEVSDMKDALLRSHQRMVAYEEEEEDIDLMDGEEEWSTIAAGQKEEATGIYSDEVIEEKEEGEEATGSTTAEPSLADLAGGDPVE